jgi:hypothetical protein
MRPSSAPKTSYRVKQQTNNSEETPKTQKPKPRVTPKKSEPDLDAPIDFNSLQFDDHQVPPR